jgi:hypothetical protein
VPGGTFRLYGLSVRSPLALPCPRDGRVADVAIRRFGGLTVRRFDDQRPSRHWFTYRRWPDGAALVRWRNLSEFVISPDGTDIRWRRLRHLRDETFRGYLLPQVLSFTLIARGQEPLHGSAVAIGGRVIAFLGDCGLGKSTLTAALVRAGYPLVTDDLLMVSRRDGKDWVEPGMPSIKLRPSIARRLLGAPRAGPRVAPGATKAILPLPSALSVNQSLPLHTLYILTRGRSVRITPLSPAAACLEIVRGAFNTVQLDQRRLASQFRFARQLAATARVRRLAYPRRLESIGRVREAVLADVGNA